MGRTRSVALMGVPIRGGGISPLALWQSQLAKYGGPGWACQETSGSVAAATNEALALGRNIIINGDFAAGDDGTWTKGAGWTIPGVTVASCDGSQGAASDLKQDISGSAPTGKTFDITFTVSNFSAGQVRGSVGGALGDWETGNGTYTQTIVSLGFATTGVRGDAAFIGDVDDITVKQKDILASTAYPGAELLVDGDMEAATTAAWTPGNSATLTKQTTNPHSGTQLLRVARNTSNNPEALQAGKTEIGKRYRATGWLRSDGNTTPQFRDGGSSIFSGTTSTVWQPFDVEYTATNVSPRCRAITSTGTEYMEADDVSVTEVNPLNADNTGATVGVSIGPADLLAFSYDATNDKLEPGAAETNSMFTPDAFTLEAYIQVSGAGVWTDNTLRVIAVWYAGADNFAQLSKNAANQLQWDFKAGGTLESIVLAVTPLTPILMTMTVDVAGVGLRAFYNGAETGSAQSVAGTFVGNITPFIGALNTTPDNVWDGLEALIANYRAVVTDADIKSMAQSLGVA